MNLVNRHRFLFLFIAAIIIDYIPVIGIPFHWTETFFHEISHGLMALLSGGSIKSITLNYDGSGFCVSQGGVRFLVSFAGYFGSIFWGAMIYLSVDSMSPKKSHTLMGIFVVVLLISAFWAKGMSTYIILSCMIALFSLIYKATSSQALKYILQLIGLFVLLDAIRSPLVLLDGKAKGDGASLSNITYVPEVVWVGVWFLLGIGALYMVYRSSYGTKQKSLWV